MGAFPGETGAPRHIETEISNIFLFEKNAYKIYKNDSAFFNEGFRNIAEKEDRFSFTQKDFDWNNALSPEVYTKLIGVQYYKGELALFDKLDEADELAIVMQRLDTKDILYDKLVRGEITKADSKAIGEQLGEVLGRVQKPVPGEGTFYENFRTRISDLKHFISSVHEHIDKDECGIYCEHLNSFATINRKLFENELMTETVADGDFHSHNAVFTKGKLSLIDTYTPKEEWGIGHRLIPVYRIGVDIWALSGEKEYFDAFLEGYESTSGVTIDRGLDALYVPYAACIAVTYLYILQQSDSEKRESALQFHNFVRKYFAQITSK